MSAPAESLLEVMQGSSGVRQAPSLAGLLGQLKQNRHGTLWPLQGTPQDPV